VTVEMQKIGSFGFSIFQILNGSCKIPTTNLIQSSFFSLETETGTGKLKWKLELEPKKEAGNGSCSIIIDVCSSR